MDATLRKAAILIDSLDSQSANSLLERFSADESARILEARVHLLKVSDSERARVIREFYAENSHTLSADKDVELESSVALRLLPAGATDELQHCPANKPEVASPSFEFLDGADLRTLARHLADEPSNDVALILCHLAPDRAAEILKQLPDAKQIDVVFRMSAIEDLSAATVSDVQASIKEVLDRKSTSLGFDAVLSMMEAVDTSARAELIEQLQVHHHELAGQLTDSIDAQPADSVRGERATQEQRKPDANHYEFEDLVQLDSRSLAILIQEADPQEILLALTGASSWVVTRLLGQLPARDEKALRQRMDRCGPLALRDIEVAQSKLVETAIQLAAEGRITLPPRRPFTSVV